MLSNSIIIVRYCSRVTVYKSTIALQHTLPPQTLIEMFTKSLRAMLTFEPVLSHNLVLSQHSKRLSHIQLNSSPLEALFSKEKVVIARCANALPAKARKLLVGTSFREFCVRRLPPLVCLVNYRPRGVIIRVISGVLQTWSFMKTFKYSHHF